MKLYKNICYLFLAVLFLSCEDYLEIDTKGTSSDKEIFSDIQGFEDAIRGVYTSFKSTDLYGENLTCGMLDNMAQYYNYNDDTFLKATSELRYKDAVFSSTIKNTWDKMFFTIASANNIIEFAKKTSIKNFYHKNYIVAEAKFLRAFLHFDALRLFSGTYPENKNELAIPYSTKFSKEKPKYLITEEVINKILEDLNSAEYLFNSVDKDAEKYFSEQEIHVSIETVWALKARIYNYINNTSKAIFYAKKVIDSNKYSIAKKQDFRFLHQSLLAKSTINEAKFNECILGIYNSNQYKLTKKLFGDENGYKSSVLVRFDYEEVFNLINATALENDVRFDNYFTNIIIGTAFKKFSFSSENKNSKRLLGINLIRLPEMYYILANAYYNTDKSASLQYLNYILRNRGLIGISLSDIAVKDKFLEILVNEIQKEYWGEGQLFFAHKTYKIPMVNASKISYPVTDTYFKLPIPNSEIY